MSYKISVSDEFLRQVKPLSKKYPSLKNDLIALQSELSENPMQGNCIGENLYKVRMKIKSKGKGKSAGARLITYTILEDDTLLLVAIYDKSEIDNVSRSYINAILREEGLL